MSQNIFNAMKEASKTWLNAHATMVNKTKVIILIK